VYVGQEVIYDKKLAWPSDGDDPNGVLEDEKKYTVIDILEWGDYVLIKLEGVSGNLFFDSGVFDYDGKEIIVAKKEIIKSIVKFNKQLKDKAPKLTGN